MNSIFKINENNIISKTQKSRSRIRVAFCCPFPVEILKPEIILTKEVPRHPCSWIRALAEELANYKDIDLHIITISQYVPCDQIIYKNDITYHILKAKLPLWLTKLFRISEKSTLLFGPVLKMKKALKLLNPDIVHGHGTEGPFSFPVVYSKFPHVISIQGIIAKIVLVHPTLRFKILKYIEKHTIQKARFIHSKTSTQESFAASLSPNSKKYFIEISLNKIFWSRKQPDFAQNIFFTGSLIKRKGIEEFIRSYIMLKSKFPDLKGYVIGKDEEGNKERFIAIAREIGVSDALIFTGQITHAQLVELYSKGGIFCLSSYIETSASVVMEAMAAGLPVVATKVGDVMRNVENEKSGLLVEKKDIPGMVKAIETLLRNKNLFLSFGKRGREIATVRWRPEMIAKKHIEMYESILSTL